MAHESMYTANQGTSSVTQRMANLGTSHVALEIIAEFLCQIKRPTKIQALKITLLRYNSQILISSENESNVMLYFYTFLPSSCHHFL